MFDIHNTGPNSVLFFVCVANYKKNESHVEIGKLNLDYDGFLIVCSCIYVLKLYYVH